MRKLGILFVVVFIFGFTSRVAAQERESDLGFVASQLFGDRIHKKWDQTGKSVQYSDHYLTILRYYGESFRFEFRPGKDNHIISADFKAGNSFIVIAMTSDGVVWVYADKNHDNHWALDTSLSPAVLRNSTKLPGDALYALNSGKLWASRDTAKTWSLDTIGIGNESIVDIALDGNANVYALSQSKKLWYQHRDSSTGPWNLVPGFSSKGIPTALFIDRMGRMFVAGTSSVTRVQVSTDTGKNWINVSAGVDENVDAFGDDDKGNVYAVGQISEAYRLTNLTPPWTAISDGITSLAQIPTQEKIINTITGDSILYAATRYGTYTSNDLGAHWAYAPNDQQTTASTFYTPLVKSAGKSFLSSNLGIFRGAEDGMPWEKVFPQDKFCWGINTLAADAAGNLYGNFPIRVNATVSRFYPVRSTNQGAHWDLDTAGQGVLGFNSQTLDHYVDAQGTQWLGGNAILYCKKPGQAWIKDTNGLGLADGIYIRQVSRNNKKGIVYTAVRKNGKYSIYSRSVADNGWSPLNADILSASDGILQSDQDGNLIVKALTFPAKLWKYDGQWKSVALPSAPSVSNLDQFLADGEGNLWLTALGGPSGAPKGLWVSTDDGANWKLAGLDGVPVQFLSSDLDTVYAVTTGNGVFKFTKNSASAGVALRPLGEPQFVLLQNEPNPFKQSTRIDFELPADGSVTLSILDLLGNEVAVLLDGPAVAGAHSADWNAARMPGGVYVCRLEYRQRSGATYSTSSKLLLLN